MRQAYENARNVADRGTDNPMQKIWNLSYSIPPDAKISWNVPRNGDSRINPNRVLIEALHCKENGIRRETLTMIGEMIRTRFRDTIVYT